MAKVSKLTAKKEEFGPVTECNAEVDGYRIGFATFHDDIDGTPLMKGLPDDMCQCPHWGYVLSGKVTFRYADRDETYEAGDAFYMAPGHAPEAEEGTELDFEIHGTLSTTSILVKLALEQGFDLLGVIGQLGRGAIATEELVAVDNVGVCLGKYRLEHEAQCKTDYPQGTGQVSHLVAASGRNVGTRVF